MVDSIGLLFFPKGLFYWYSICFIPSRMFVDSLTKQRKTKRMSYRLKSMSGVSLIETVVVIAIIGILAAIGVPNFLDWNRQAKLKSAVTNLYGQLSLARMSAINQNTSVTIALSQPAASPITVTFLNPTGGTVLPALTLDSEVSLATSSNGAVTSPQDIQFNAMGLRKDTGNVNNLCVTSTGAYTGGACTATSNQALNFKNTKNVNYRLVVLPTGKASFCVVGTCAQ